MHISDFGLAYLDSREGVVLKAYRDPVGVWTIGAGLTAASGVIAPKAGMTITRTEARSLLQQALRNNYEPAVNRAMGSALQYEFDGGTSFHFNTGAIGRASWVKAWKRDDDRGVRNGLGAWDKAKGKVLPGLKRRRAEEADIILLNQYPKDLNIAADAQPADGQFARFVISVSVKELAAIRDGFRTIGFDPGPVAGFVWRSSVEAFQKRYDLAVDGRIGKATLSTLQRELDARSAAKTGGGGIVVGGGGAAGSDAIAPDPAAAPDASGLPADLVFWGGIALAAAATLYLAWMAWHYRDMIAARLNDRAPRLAAWLRSF